MTKAYLSIIAVMALYICLTFSYTQESVRNHVAIRVSQWKELKKIERDSHSISIDTVKFEQVDLPSVRGIN